MTLVPTGWSCPKCSYHGFTRLEDGRKQCIKCGRIFGESKIKKHPDTEYQNKKGNFVGKAGRLPKFIG